MKLNNINTSLDDAELSILEAFERKIDKLFGNVLITEGFGLNLDRKILSTINEIYHDISTSPETLFIKKTIEKPHGHVDEYPSPPWKPSVPTINSYDLEWVPFTGKDGFRFNLRIGISTGGSASDWLGDESDIETWGTEQDPGHGMVWIDEKALMNGGIDLYEQLAHEISHLLDPKNRHIKELSDKKAKQQKLVRAGKMKYADQDVEQQADIDALAARRVYKWKQEGISKKEALQIISKPLMPISDREETMINKNGRKYKLALYKLINDN